MFIIQNTYLTDILLLCVMGLVATFINPNWAFSPLEILPTFGTYNDHWLYLGMMLDLSDKLQYISDTYFRHYSFERLPWLVPGALLYQTFTPIVANYILKFMVYSISVIGIYWALRNLFGRKTGLFVAFCLGGYSWFLRSAGWDYIDGVGIAYFILTFGLLVSSVYAQHKPTWRINSLLTGVMLANLIGLNTYWVVFMPHLLIIAMWLNHRQHKRPIIQSLVWAIMGSSMMLGVYALISYIMSGEWLFLKSSIRSSNILAGDTGLADLVTLLYSQMIPHYHIIPLILMVAGIFWASTRKPMRHFGIQRILLIQAVWFYIVLIISHYVILPYLIIFLYSSYMIPATFLWLGGLVAPRLEALNTVQFNRLLVTICLIFLAPFALSVLIPQIITLQNNTLLLFIAVGFFVGGFIFTRCTVVIIIASIIGIGWLTSHQIYVFQADRWRNQETFALALDAYQAIQDHYVNNGVRDIEYILDARASTKSPAFVVSSLFFDGHYARGNYSLSETPDDVSLSQDPFRRDSSGYDSQKTVIITRYPASLDRIIAKYISNNRQFAYTLEQTIPLQRHDMTMYVSFITLSQRLIALFVLEFGNLDAENRLEMTGFNDIELANNRTYRWTSEPLARMTFALDEDTFDAQQMYQVQFWTLAPLEAQVLDSLTLTINGVQLELERIPQGVDTLFQAPIDGQILQGDVLELIFETDKISRPADFGYADPRTLGVALDWLTIAPIEDETP